MNSTAMAHPTSGSWRRWRNLVATSTRYPAKMRAHSKMEPSNAAHRVATLNSAGVAWLPFSATYDTEKSRVMRARSMANTDNAAPPNTSQAHRCTRSSRRAATMNTPMADDAIATAMPKTPRVMFMASDPSPSDGLGVEPGRPHPYCPRCSASSMRSWFSTR